MKRIFMKHLSLLSFAALLLFLGAACDRHPASQTIPGYKASPQSLDGKQALAPTKHPVRLFSEKKNDVN